MFKYVEDRIIGLPLRNEICLKALGFIDDATFTLSSVKDVKAVLQGLDWYERNFRVKIHKGKSNLLPILESENTEEMMQELWIAKLEKAKILGVTWTREIKLGNLWEEKIQKIEGMLAMANDIEECSLFFRATYVNTYCLPLLFYFAPAFVLDEGSAKRIEQII